ncbi:L-ribulose-5-phosphate 4-epimerase [Desulfitobacterium hafniense DP7]|uniref:L-ribulose-5-phosphate 4-epimerase n=1 Tax=Desulfitobacterium hafniense DP7 TaxID=537010 RepID=G9XVW2_DESHA|nr:L-ribulose-5-phosphate 4-epimerase AraD [Desulfitobacterium hafniense]EHL04225.1 L-ribulose-5-phosphate 4-epimerase [Desulfitobacterium hafniense DP7]
MLEKLKKCVYDAYIDLVKNDLVILTWGNVSAFDKESALVVIKPSGIPHERMTPDDMVVVDINGQVVEGKNRPSSDTPTHLELYKAFNLGSVVHTHSKWATIWSQALKSVPCLGTTHADSFYGNIPVTRTLRIDEIQDSYEKETGMVIIETFDKLKLNPSALEAVLVANHGPFTWGDTTEKAVENAIVLEHVCEMAYFTLSTNPEAFISQDLLDKHYLRKHGKNAYYGQRVDG